MKNIMIICLLRQERWGQATTSSHESPTPAGTEFGLLTERIDAVICVAQLACQFR